MLLLSRKTGCENSLAATNFTALPFDQLF